MPEPESVQAQAPVQDVPAPDPTTKLDRLRARGLRLTTRDFSAGRNVTDQPIDIAGFMEKLSADLLRRQMADTARRSYEHTARGFLVWAHSKNLTLGTMPETAPMEYLAETLSENATAAHVFGQQGLKTLFSILADNGVKIAPYTWYVIELTEAEKAAKIAKRKVEIEARKLARKAARERERTSMPPPANGAPETSVSEDIFDSVPQQPQAVALPMRQVDPTPAPAPAPVAAPPQRVRRVVQTSPTAGIFPQSGQVRIHKRATEPGLPPGQLILIGQYTIDDLSGEGSITQFIHTHLVPAYGPFPGGKNTVYIVERLDDRGQIMPGQRWEIPVLAASGPSRNPAQEQINNVVQAAAEPSQIETKLVDYLQKSESESRNAYMSLLTDLRDSTKGGGMDATTLMLLLEKHRPEPMNWKEIMSEIRKEREQSTPAPIILPDSPKESSNQGMEVVVGLLGKMIDKLGQISTPPPAPPRDPMVEILLKTAIERAFAPPPPSPLEPKMEKLLEMAISPQKTKLSEMAENVREIIALTKAIRPDEQGPHPIIEGLGMLLENADKVGEMLTRVSAIRAPAVAEQQQQQPVQEQKKLIEVPPLPSEAILALRSTAQAQATDQAIVDALFKLMQTLTQSPAEGHKRLCQAILKGFLEVGSKSEVRALVTNIFVKCGERNIATEEVVEKVTTCLHKHYSAIYKSITNQDKVLPDAPKATEEKKEKVEEKKVEGKTEKEAEAKNGATNVIKIEELTR